MLVKLKKGKSKKAGNFLGAKEFYYVMGIENNYFRIIDDMFEPALYKQKLFKVIDGDCPDDWERKDYGDGEFSIEPKYFYQYFYEDFFDGDEIAQALFYFYWMKYRHWASDNAFAKIATKAKEKKS